MKTFRGLVNSGSNSQNYSCYLEYIDDSFWWGNREFAVKNDPQLFKYIEKNKIDKSEFITGHHELLDNEGCYWMGFKKGSKGYDGLDIRWYSKNRRLRPILDYLNEKVENSFISSPKQYFLGNISSLENLTFSIDHKIEDGEMVLNKDIHEYIVKNLSPDKLFEKSEIAMYYKKDELVSVLAPKKIIHLH